MSADGWRALERSAGLSERLPNAVNCCDYADFGFWCLRVESVRYIGGYGRMSWVQAEDRHEELP